MPISYSFTSSFGHHPEAYFVNASMTYDVDGSPTNVVVSGSVWTEKNSYTNGLSPVGQYQYTFLYETASAAKGTIMETQADTALQNLILGKSKVGAFSTGSTDTLMAANPGFYLGARPEQFQSRTKFNEVYR